MLLDSYVVELGQPWWLTETELRSAEKLSEEEELPTFTVSGLATWVEVVGLVSKIG